MSTGEFPLYGGLYDVEASVLSQAVATSKLLRQVLTDLTHTLTISETHYRPLLSLPRRKAADASNRKLAELVANLIYPCYGETLAPIIRYEEDVRTVRRLIIQQRQEKLDRNRLKADTSGWKRRILAQGPWDPERDPVPLTGAPSLPMPVEISDEGSLRPFFAHLEMNGALESSVGKRGEEPYYETPLVEFEKGVLYADARMDLCKMVVGPTHIERLLDTLEKNSFVRHFLLGNNIIGPVGAERIARFCADPRYKERIETWYLAGNCINAAGFKKLVAAWKGSEVITNIWLKRNPLMTESWEDVVTLITETPNLRTLDLDQTELGDEGVANIFEALSKHEHPIGLRNIYLNAVGASTKACTALAHFLSNPTCPLESLYLSNNPLGPPGTTALSSGLVSNTSLHRLTLSSTGLSSPSTSLLLSSLTSHPTLLSLDLSHSFSTPDLSQRYNLLSSPSLPHLTSLLSHSPLLRYLNLGLIDITRPEWSLLLSHALTAPALCFFDAHPLRSPPRTQLEKMADRKLMQRVTRACTRRIQNLYRPTMEYKEFLASELRWLRSPGDVRLIDSVYRNRDAALARRGEKRLEKWWGDGEVLRGVMLGEREIKVRMCPMKAAAVERGRRAVREREEREGVKGEGWGEGGLVVVV